MMKEMLNGRRWPMTRLDSGSLAPELSVAQWFNTDGEITLAGLRGGVVVIEAFQMSCPGCVAHGLPQTQRIQRAFGRDLTVLGLHTVFEHHEAMRPVSLEAFLHEYRITFAVGVDAHEPGVDSPITMRRFGLQGTPSLVVIDRAGRIRVNAFGQSEDLPLGAALGRLLDEEPVPATDPGCDPQLGCPAPTEKETTP